MLLGFQSMTSSFVCIESQLLSPDPNLFPIEDKLIMKLFLNKGFALPWNEVLLCNPITLGLSRLRGQLRHGLGAVSTGVVSWVSLAGKEYSLPL